MASLFREDSSLAERRNEYAQLGSLLRSLPDPDVHPAFLTRVMAHAREEGMAHRVWNPWHMLTSVVGLAAVVLFAGYLALYETVTAPATELADSSGTTQVAEREDWTNEELVVGQMTRLIDEGVVLELYPEAEPVDDVAVETEPEVEIMTEDWQEAIARDVYAYVSSDHWSSTTEEVLWNAPDIETEYDMLTAPQREEFVELLRSYGENLS